MFSYSPHSIVAMTMLHSNRFPFQFTTAVYISESFEFVFHILIVVCMKRRYVFVFCFFYINAFFQLIFVLVILQLCFPFSHNIHTLYIFVGNWFCLPSCFKLLNAWCHDHGCLKYIQWAVINGGLTVHFKIYTHMPFE